MKGKMTAYLAALTTITLWGLSYIWADRLLDQGIPVEFFVPARSLAAGVLLFCINKIARKDMRIRRKDWVKFLLLALCMPFIYFVAETYGLYLTESPTITALVVATNPIFAMIVGMLIFKEKFSPLNIAGVFIALGGLWLVSWTNGSTGQYFIWGILILCIAVISEVSQIAFTKSLSDTYAPSVIVMYQFLFGAVYFLPLFLTKGIKDFQPSLYLGWSVIYPTLALALLCSATAFTTWAYAIKHLGVAHTSVFLALSPLMTAFFAFLFGEETLTTIQWTGLAIGMAGIYLTQIVTTQKKNNDTERSLRDLQAAGSSAGAPELYRPGAETERDI